MANSRIFGYSEPLVPRAGTNVDIKISVEGSNNVDAQLVRLLHGDEDPAGPGFVEQEVDSPINGNLEVKRQFLQLGNYCHLDDDANELGNLRSFTLFAHVQPCLQSTQRQVVMGNWDLASSCGYALGINPEGKVCLWLGDGNKVDQITSDTPAIPRCWYFVAATFDAQTHQASLHVINCVNSWNSRISTLVPFELDSWATEKLSITPAIGDGKCSFLLGGAWDSNPSRRDFVALQFNGKIDRSGVFARPLERNELEQLAAFSAPSPKDLLAYWDPTANITKQGVNDDILDTSGNNLHMHGVNRPVRLMTGANWKGADSYHMDASQYGGVHFHSDALTDAKWATTCSITLPENMVSGVYALRLTHGKQQDHVPFIVTPHTPKSAIAVLLPTMTYLAYANEHLSYEAPIAQAIVAHTPVISQQDIEYKKLEEFGLSTYDHHADGSGCCYSSWRRPIVSLRPKYRLSAMNFAWGLPADLSLIWWLEQSKFDYDVITDHDLHALGKAALEPYKVVINGTHPEYYTANMMDATEDYLRQGGRLMYTGGNGYYWVAGQRKDEAHCMEVRKLDVGSRAWQAEPGEGHLASTGERSGLWRSRGRAPQKIVGVGFSAEGMDESQPFERMPDSYHKRVSWIFKGLGDEELIGDFGLANDGAAGVELDRYDLALGTPPHTQILASSSGHSDNYPLVSEEITYAFPGRGGTQDPQVRGDMIFFTTPNNGAVFAAGSIAWSQALPINNGDNNVATVMTNVLDALTSPGQLPGVEFVGDEKLWR